MKLEEFNKEVETLCKNLYKITKDPEDLKIMEHIEYNEAIVTLYMASWQILDKKIKISSNDYYHLCELIKGGHMTKTDYKYIKELKKLICLECEDILFLI